MRQKYLSSWNLINTKSKVRRCNRKFQPNGQAIDTWTECEKGFKALGIDHLSEGGSWHDTKPNARIFWNQRYIGESGSDLVELWVMGPPWHTISQDQNLTLLYTLLFPKLFLARGLICNSWATFREIINFGIRHDTYSRCSEPFRHRTIACPLETSPRYLLTLLSILS